MKTLLSIGLGLLVGCGPGLRPRQDGGPTPDAARPDAGATSDAGRDAGASPTLDAGPLAVDPLAVAHAATVLASCVGDDGIERNISFAFNEIGPMFPELSTPEARACLAASTDGCAAVARCTGFRLGVSAGCPTTCDGDTLRFCGDGFSISRDCARLGRVCSAEARDCIEPGATPEACDPVGVVHHSCVDGRVKYCDAHTNHFALGPKCADYGLGCGDDVGRPGRGCVGLGGACRDDYSDPVIYFAGVRCLDADRIESCVAGGLTTRSCGALGAGLSCKQHGSDPPFCGLADECLPGTTYTSGSLPMTCDGTTAVFCDLGRIERVDCTSLGFTGCSPRYGCTPPGL